jgi:hypothetical protein
MPQQNNKMAEAMGAYGMPPSQNPSERRGVSNSVLNGIGNPVPLGADRSKLLVPGAAQYAPQARFVPKSSSGGMENLSGNRLGSGVANSSINQQLEYDPFHTNAARYALW